jgi:hypothetical protein
MYYNLFSVTAGGLMKQSRITIRTFNVLSIALIAIFLSACDKIGKIKESDKISGVETYQKSEKDIAEERCKPAKPGKPGKPKPCSTEEKELLDRMASLDMPKVLGQYDANKDECLNKAELTQLMSVSYTFWAEARAEGLLKADCHDNEHGKDGCLQLNEATEGLAKARASCAEREPK